MCLPCYHIYKFLEQHYYKHGHEKSSDLNDEAVVEAGNSEGVTSGKVIGGTSEISPQFEWSHNRREQAASVDALDVPEDRSSILVEDG